MRSVNRSQKGIRNLCSVQIVLSCHLQPLRVDTAHLPGFLQVCFTLVTTLWQCQVSYNEGWTEPIKLEDLASNSLEKSPEHPCFRKNGIARQYVTYSVFLKPSTDNCPEGELFFTWNCFPILGAKWLPGENSPSHKNNEEKDGCTKSCGYTFDQYMIYSKKEYLCYVNQMILSISLDVSLEQNIWKPARP